MKSLLQKDYMNTLKLIKFFLINNMDFGKTDPMNSQYGSYNEYKIGAR